MNGAAAGPSSPEHDGRGAPLAAQEPLAAEADPSTPRHRTHPITPLVAGWKIVVGIIAVLMAQNIAQLVEDFTVQRALIGLAMVAVVVVVAIVLSAFSWWFTSYAVEEGGVSLHTGMISRSREYAPRARIESVSIERPLLARLLGLAKVRVEVAGGGESYLDIQYVRSAEAEELRQGILGVAALAVPGPQDRPVADGTAELDGTAGSEGTGRTEAAGGERTPEARAEVGASGREEQLLGDGVTDGALIAQIPTERLLLSLLRDVGFLLLVATMVLSIVGVAVGIGLSIWRDGFSIAFLIALLPTVIAIPKHVLGRIESGWGFVSRFTERGLRMRRGLANTRTDNIAAGRIQRIELRRPLLWRGPGWTAAAVTVAGIEDDDENGAENVLPVGTRDELRATLGHLAVPLGTADDLETIEHLLTAPAREIDGLRTPVRAYWIDRRTSVSVLLPGALVHRRGILTKRLEIIPRERLQQLSVTDGPFARRLAVLDLEVGVAGHSLTLDNLPRRDVLALHAVLARDAATLRRYRDRARWPQPALGIAEAPTADARSRAEAPCTVAGGEPGGEQ